MKRSSRFKPPSVLILMIILFTASAAFAQPQSPNFLITKEAFSAAAVFDSSEHYAIFSSVCSWSVADTHFSPSFIATSGFLTPSYGSATGAFLVVDPLAIDFGEVLVDSLSSQIIQLSDTGYWSLYITNLLLTIDSGFQIVPPPELPDTIFGRSSRNYILQFHPNAAVNYRDTMVIEHSVGEPIRVPIQGVGAAAQIIVRPDTLRFGDLWIGRAARDTIRIGNPGNAALHVDSITSGNPAIFPAVMTPLTIAHGDSVALPYTITLPDTLSFSALLTVHSDAGSPTIYARAHGVWTELRAYPAAISFDSVMIGDSITVTDTLRSIGNHGVTLQSVHLTTNNFDIVQSPANDIPAYGQTTLTVKFRAANPGVFHDTLVIVNDLGADLRVPLFASSVLSVIDPASLIPTGFFLDQNYPNPFNPATNIRFGLPRTAPIRIEVFDILGRKAATLADRRLPAGYHSLVWSCSQCPSGMYIVRMQAEDRVFLRKMLLMK